MKVVKRGSSMSRIRSSIVEKVYARTKISFCPLCLTAKVHLIEHSSNNRLLNKKERIH